MWYRVLLFSWVALSILEYSELLVSGRAVGAGHGDVEQAQVDRKLTAVMDQMVQGEVAERDGPGFFEPQPTHNLEAPKLTHALIVGGRHGSLAAGDVVVKGLQQVGHRLGLVGFEGGWIEVEFGRRQYRITQADQADDMRSQPTCRKRLLVRTPLQLVVSQPFQMLARCLRFVLKLLAQRINRLHRDLLLFKVVPSLLAMENLQPSSSPTRKSSWCPNS